MMSKYAKILLVLVIFRLLLVGAPILLEPFHPPLVYVFVLLNIVATIVGLVYVGHFCGIIRGQKMMVNTLVVVAILDLLLRVTLTVMVLLPSKQAMNRDTADGRQRPNDRPPETEGDPRHNLPKASIATIFLSRKISSASGDAESPDGNESDGYDDDDMDIEMALRDKLMHEYSSVSNVDSEERPKRKRRGTNKSKQVKKKKKRRPIAIETYEDESEDALYDAETPAAVDPESGATN